MPALTVVVPVHNGEASLARVLSAVRGGLRPDDALVAVDDRSTDGSRRVLESTGVTILESEGRPGAAGARNTGANSSSTGWILFLDADAVPPPGWREMLESRMPGADAVQAVYGPEAPGTGAATFYKNYYYHYTFTRRIRGPHIKGCGTFFFAVSRERFASLGGFDENIAGATIEDADFSERLWAAGGRIVIAPEIEVLHLREYTLRSLLSYEWRMMKAKALYILRRSKDRGAPSISVASFGEMLPVLSGAVLPWAALAGFASSAAGAGWGLPVGLSALLAAFLVQAPFLCRMVRAGGSRGLRAGLLVLPDLMLIAPASVSALGTALAGRRY